MVGLDKLALLALNATLHLRRGDVGNGQHVALPIDLRTTPVLPDGGKLAAATHGRRADEGDDGKTIDVPESDLREMLKQIEQLHAEVLAALGSPVDDLNTTPSSDSGSFSPSEVSDPPMNTNVALDRVASSQDSSNSAHQDDVEPSGINKSKPDSTGGNNDADDGSTIKDSFNTKVVVNQADSDKDSADQDDDLANDSTSPSEPAEPANETTASPISAMDTTTEGEISEAPLFKEQFKTLQFTSTKTRKATTTMTLTSTTTVSLAKSTQGLRPSVVPFVDSTNLQTEDEDEDEEPQMDEKVPIPANKRLQFSNDTVALKQFKPVHKVITPQPKPVQSSTQVSESTTASLTAKPAMIFKETFPNTTMNGTLSGFKTVTMVRRKAQ